VPGGRSRAWGWYRLDPAWAAALVADADIRPHELVLDIGAGDGALTAPLLAAGARVIAIELHPGRAAALRRRFADDDIRVVQADATDLRLPRRPFRVVANPPWAITEALLRRLLHPASRLEHASLLLKRSAARRWSGHPGVHHVLREGPTVPRRAFRPAPPTDGRVLLVERRR
jgi:23S rRNA (adenine-N6)-dimethyltransferase